ncbi:MAG: hypothetical protein J6W23_14180 [Victivallales bacterium]|nr:hypothetical protein [Victivallales bacterium]MBO7532617.1 hypothetical protein [Victivallales bacterium]
MKNKHFHLIMKLLCMTVISAMCVMAQSATEMPNSQALRPALQAMGTVTKFHRMAIGEPEIAAEKFLDNRCFRRWKQRMEPLKKELLTDFFVGSMEITGSYDATSAVSAIYNPFWDTILLLEIKLPEEGGYGSVTKFAMLAGETFRGEKPAKYPIKTVVAKNSLFMELATVFSKTAEHFDKTFPQKATPSLGEFAVSNLEDEMKLIALRAALRLKFIQKMLKNQEQAKIMKSMQIILQYGERDDFQQLFTDARDDKHICTVMALPDDVREQFVIYSYYEIKGVAVFAYIPLFMPRLIAFVKVPKEQSASPSLEIYDLNNSAAIVEAVNKMKGDGK